MSSDRSLHATLLSLRQQLIDRKQKLAAAESVTAGFIQQLLGSVTGASDYYEGGITTYSLRQKQQLLHLDAILLQQSGGVAAEVSAAMAQQVAQLFNVDISIATTGYAEPYPHAGISTPTAYIAVWFDQQLHQQQVNSHNYERITNQYLFANNAIQFLHQIVSSKHS